MVVIADYGMGNLRSILYKLHKFHIEAEVSSSNSVIDKADRIILPGVGHFGRGMENIRKKGLIDILNKKVLQDKVPVLGICLGAQLLTKHSEEGDCEGLGWIDAATKKFEFKDNLRVPHIGWDKVNIIKRLPFWPDLPEEKRFYFVHSYYIECYDKASIIGISTYGRDFVSVLGKENIFGTQFHPEKSHRDGFELILRFVNSKGDTEC